MLWFLIIIMMTMFALNITAAPLTMPMKTTMKYPYLKMMMIVVCFQENWFLLPQRIQMK